jgi:hypothetical protein
MSTDEGMGEEMEGDSRRGDEGEGVYLVYGAHGRCDSTCEVGILVRLRASRSAYTVKLQCHMLL